MAEFAFKEVDQEGLEILDVISEAPRFNHWMYNTIKPYCKGQILEVGSGIGNISRCFLEDGANITLSDIRENYCSILSENFKSYSNCGGVQLLDLVAPDFETRYASQLESYDTVYALNVVEHIKDDALAIQNCRKLLKKDGHLVILVPAYQKLYNGFDVELEHYRRYNRQMLNNLISNNGFSLVHHQYFNFMGIFGWWFSGNVLKKKSIPRGQMRLYNTLVPIFKIIDQCVFKQAGLSVISVGKK